MYRMNRMCVQAGIGGALKPRKHEQRLLRNMGVHKVCLHLRVVGWSKQENISDWCSDINSNAQSWHNYCAHFNFPGSRWSWTYCRFRLMPRRTWGWTSWWGWPTSSCRTSVWATRTTRSVRKIWELSILTAQTERVRALSQPEKCKRLHWAPSSSLTPASWQVPWVRALS